VAGEGTGGLLQLRGGTRVVWCASIGKEEDEGRAHWKTMEAAALGPNPS
jgi:hypothetical protein